MSRIFRTTLRLDPDKPASAQAAHDDVDGTAALCEAQGVVAKAAIAKAALPACNIVCITGEEMVTKASGYIDALYEQNPEAVGGKPADESYFYLAESEG